MKKLISIIVIAVMATVTLNAQNIWRVNNTPGVDADYTTAQEAHDAATAGDIIYFEGSIISYGNLIISKKLTIIGPGYFLSENPQTPVVLAPAKLGTLTFSTGSDETVFTGMTVTGATTIKSCHKLQIIRNNMWIINGFTDDNSSDLLISQNYVNSSIAFNNTTNNTIITNNYIAGSIAGSLTSTFIISNNYSNSYIGVSNSTIQNNIVKDVATGIRINNNVLHNNILAISGTDINGNKYSVDLNTVFVDYNGTLGYSADGKWQLKDGSPASGAGISGEDCGMFDGSTPYVLSGIPAYPHIYNAIIPASGSKQSGLPVTIKIKSKN